METQMSDIQKCIDLAAQGESRIKVEDLNQPKEWAKTCVAINGLPTFKAGKPDLILFGRQFMANAKSTQVPKGRVNEVEPPKD